LATDVASRSAPVAPAPKPLRISLLDAEPQFAAAIPPEDLRLAHRVLTVAELPLAPGPWLPEHGDGCDRLLGFLIMDGVVAHEVLLANGQALQLLGRGDVVEPFGALDAGVPAAHGWLVLEDAVVVAIDHRFVAATRRWPELSVALHRQLAAQAVRASVHTALAQLGRVELRVLAMLWHLADRWGVVTPGGIVLKVRLTHELLGLIVGARRPTVTLALKQLGCDGHVTRRPDGLLVLAPGSRDVLRPTLG
jgi:CRP-like cAMP-binding protein